MRRRAAILRVSGDGRDGGAHARCSRRHGGCVPRDAQAGRAAVPCAVRARAYARRLAGIPEVVEAFDRAADGIVLGKKASLPVLAQPAKVVQALIDPKAGDHHNRAFHLLEKYEFVFQVVRSQPLPGVGPKIGRVLDGALDKLGLSRGMDLAPYERDINAVTQPDYHVLAEDRHLTSDGADFMFDTANGEGRFAHVTIKFEIPASVVARFERQSWWTPVLDIEVKSDLRCEIHDDVTEALEHMYWKEPEQLKRKPVRWVLFSESVRDEKPKGRGWKKDADGRWWHRNEVLWLAPGAEAPKSERL